MKLTLYQVDAFTNELFSGNPAAVCPLENEFLPDDLMQKIALENNLSETAFFIRTGKGYHIRWFTPTAEVKLCGHATLASAFVIFNFLDKEATTITFESKSGPLYISKLSDGLIQLNFPAVYPEEVQVMPELAEALGISPIEMYRSHQDFLVICENEKQIYELAPNFNQLLKMDLRGVIVSSRAKQFDFISRFFAPKVGVNEDPVTGSAHCILTPYWAKKLNKNRLNAKQVSKRGGELLCELKDNRVLLAGQAVLYMLSDAHIFLHSS